ncbi:MAG: hypothetical protein CMC13_14805 [Flavobacteriaceae bacterium]|nr:hypothetical protein [Flavobacteriaceae bacterium]|tara:strand:+ start:76882 stop:77616 length:735 start_codon:yes stop_codon:yes gene_type:complete
MEKYFYATKKAEFYDLTIESVIPNYNLMLQVVHNFIRSQYDLNEEIKILDIGAGTGNDSLPILESLKNSTLDACDLSQEMCKVFENNAEKRNITFDRFTFQVENYLDVEYKKKYFDIAISAYCIHHYELKDKLKFFKKVFSELKAGGVFILVDLSNYESESISQYCHESDIAYIDTSFDKLVEKENSEVRMHLLSSKEGWIYHMDNDNILDTTEIQIHSLKKVGFVSVECIFKYLQHSIVIAKK